MGIGKTVQLCADKVSLLYVLQNIRLTKYTRDELSTMVDKIDDEIEIEQSNEKSIARQQLFM